MNPEVIIDCVHRNLQKLHEFPPSVRELCDSISEELTGMGASDLVLAHYMPCITWYITGFADAFCAEHDREAADVNALASVEYLVKLVEKGGLSEGIGPQQIPDNPTKS